MRINQTSRCSGTVNAQLLVDMGRVPCAGSLVIRLRNVSKTPSLGSFLDDAVSCQNVGKSLWLINIIAP